MNELKKRSSPWYEQFDTWHTLACKYMRSYINIASKDKRYDPEFKNYEYFSLMKLIFESNLIEGAGMTLGNTEKVISKFFPKIPEFYEFRKQARGNDFCKFIIDIDWEKIRRELQDENKLIIPSYIFRKKSKSAIEVLQHFKAISIAMVQTIDYQIKWMRYLIAMDIKKITNDQEGIKKFLKEKCIQSEPLEIRPDFLSEDKIKELHAVIADGLMDKEAGVGPGEYRIDSRHVGYNMLFPAPESIPSSMKLYIDRVNELVRAIDLDKPINHFESNACDAFLTAARISYEFVRIHPFPDFNGRISRILLMMILHFYQLPFYLTLRGNKKGRNRYLRALKSANSGDLKPYATLIAMNVVDSFREIDEIIKFVGLTPLADINS